MKWITILLVWSAVLLLSVCCCGTKKIRTETTTVIQVDTVIKVVRDTVLKTVSVPLYDTAFIESSTSEARAYYNVKTQKIDLQLKGKVFDVPVQLHKTTFIKQQTKENEYSKSFYVILFFGLLVILFLAAVILKR